VTRNRTITDYPIDHLIISKLQGTEERKKERKKTSEKQKQQSVEIKANKNAGIITLIQHYFTTPSSSNSGSTYSLSNHCFS
jgi:predicted ribosome quality control (RQC) complex YloA/Tae2 family protein